MVKTLVCLQSKKRITRFILWCLCLFFIYDTNAQNITVDFQKLSLEEAIQGLEKDYGLLFSYRQSDVENLQVTYRCEAEPVSSFLKNLLAQTNLDFELGEDGFVLLSQKDDIERIKFFFCGTIIDQKTNDLLAGANVYLNNSSRGVATDNQGRFSFQTDEASDTLVISYVGYKTQRLPAAYFTLQDCPTIGMATLNYRSDFVVVTDYLTDGIELGSNNETTILKFSKIKTLPGQVEPDVLRTLQFLPGIQSPDGTASGLSIRGSTPDQNLILWERIPIYHTAHHFGMITAFNPYIIDEAKVYRGGFGAKYGGRVAGVIDLKSGNPYRKESTFKAGTDFMTGYTNGDVKLLNGKFNFIYSLRHALTDFMRIPGFETINNRNLQNILIQNFKNNEIPSFYSVDDKLNYFDTHLKASYELSKSDQIEAAFFLTENDYKLRGFDEMSLRAQMDTLSLQNQGWHIGWKHKWGTNFSTKLNALCTDYGYVYSYNLTQPGTNIPQKSGEKSSNIREYQFRWLNEIKTNTGHKLDIGYELFQYDVFSEIALESTVSQQAIERIDLESNVHALFSSFKTNPKRKLGEN